MLKRKVLFPAFIALLITGFPSNILAAGLRGGYFGAAAPIYLVPASADIYAELNRAGTLGDNLAALVRTYRAHPGTAAALDQLTAAIGPAALQQFNTLLQAAPARVGVFATIPTNSSTAPEAAVIAQLRPGSVANGGNPLAGLATFAPATSYQGTPIYRVTFTGGLGSAYGAIVSGDGVIAGDVASIRAVVDAATFHAPALAVDRDFDTAVAQIPALRTMTFYISRGYLQRAARLADQQAAATGVPGGAGTLASLAAYQRSYAIGITAYPNGISVVSSAAPSTYTPTATPNNGASLVGNNAVVYASLANLAGILRASGLLSSSTLSQAQAQTGIDIARDVLPLIEREVVVDINDSTSPLISTVVAAGLAGNNSSLASIPALPGSLELATEVSDPGLAKQSVDRIVAALTRAAGGSAGQSLFSKATLPDGSTGYVVTALPSLGYTFRRVNGHYFMVLSTNLPADVIAASNSSTTLAADPDYQAALSAVGGTGPSATQVSYTNVTRLFALVDKILAYAQSQRVVSASDVATYRQAAEPLIAPFRSTISVARLLPSGDTQTQAFITVR